MLKDDVGEKKGQPVLGRRKFTQGLATGTALIALSTVLPNNAMGFSHEDALGGGDSGGDHDHDWASIVKSFRDGLATIAKAAIPAGFAYGDMLEALGLTQDAAKIRGKIENLKKSGDEFGPSDALDEYNALSESARQKLAERKAEAANLSAEQKEKLAEGMAKYVPALGTAIKGAIQVANSAKSAAGAGTPGPMDGLEAVDAATTIPDLAPAAVKFVEQSIAVGDTLYEIATTADVATEDIPTMNLE